MKQYFWQIILAGACLCTVSCATPQKTVDAPVTATPAPYVLTPGTDNRAEMELTFHIPEKTLSKRSRLIIVPRLMVGDSLYSECTPLVVDASIYADKLRRRIVLEGYEDPYGSRKQLIDKPAAAFTLPYRETLTLPASADTARVEAIVTTDGCGQCTGIDTIEVASLVRQAVYVDWMAVTFAAPSKKAAAKVVHGQGEARLQFAINLYDIDLSLGNNRAELDSMLQDLRPVLTDSLATVNSFTITGMASADGSLKFNTVLARNRANAAMQFVAQQLSLTEEQTAAIRIGSRPEGWQPVLLAMKRDGHPDTVRVADILQRLADKDDDAQERLIRRLPCWKDIREKYLAKDRKVEYTYTYTIRSFTTDSEVRDMYPKRPDAFNEEELLHAASLMETDAEKMDVYRTLLARFPDCEPAINNLAYLYVKAGRMDEARALLQKLPALYPDLENKQLRIREEGTK